jgi:hypothetical protein
MLLDGGGKSSWEDLRVHPVALSYEWDPCDGMKVRELLMRESNSGHYMKSPGEDERSMKMGLFGWKGRVHVGVCRPSRWLDEGGRPHQVLAEAIDLHIMTAMKLWPNQLWAAEQVKPGVTQGLWESSNRVCTECEDRIAQVIRYVQLDQSFSATAIRTKWCEITSQPVFNLLEAKAGQMVQDVLKD